MKVLVFEWLSSGGLWVDEVFPNPLDSIQVQGRQMLDAIVNDFLLGGAEVLMPLDTRSKDPFSDDPALIRAPIDSATELPAVLTDLASQSDFVLLIAPETDSSLLKCLGWVEANHHKLISPGPALVKIASNKSATFDYLQANHFHSFPNRIEQASLSIPAGSLPFPAVIKPEAGAGSEGVEFIPDLKSWKSESSDWSEFRLEEFMSGTSISVSVICRQGGHLFLPPTKQIFDRQPLGNYVEAGYPLPATIANRATRLAERAIQALPPTQGYIGIDMVISDKGVAHDCLIEVNPRLTMSYLKLREICADNLAMKMLPIPRSRAFKKALGREP